MSNSDSKPALTSTICLDNAKACREMARNNSNSDQRRTLEEIAKAWDQLARDLAGRD